MEEKELIPVDSLFFNEEERENIQKMAALGYMPEDIAIYLGLNGQNIRLFVQDADTMGTTVNLLIREGILVTRATPEMKLHEHGATGNIEAIKELEKIKRKHFFEQLIQQQDADELY